jgi:hypothetical protein
VTFPFGQYVELVTRTKGPPDALGNDTWTAITTTARGAFAPAGSVEQVQGQDTVTTQPKVYLPPDTKLTAVDAVTVDGVTYEVDGVPELWVNPFTGHRFGIEVRLKDVTG